MGRTMVRQHEHMKRLNAKEKSQVIKEKDNYTVKVEYNGRNRKDTRQQAEKDKSTTKQRR